MTESGYGRSQQVGLVGGPLLFTAVTLGPDLPGLSPAGTAVLASTLWIATWWITEAVPIPATSLLPIVLFPTLGVESVADAAAPYADPVVFLFLGGFLLALGIERWGLHRRIALAVLLRVGDAPRRLLGGFMLVTAFLSMWVSNTATAMMMVPIGMAVVAQRQATAADRTPEEMTGPVVGTLDAGVEPIASDDADVGDTAGGDGSDDVATDGGTADAAAESDTFPERSTFGIALMLGIAYAASIGGVATLIGTPPNAILAGVASTALGIQIGFLEWMQFAFPLSAVFIVIAWLVLGRGLSTDDGAAATSDTGGEAALRAEQQALGPMTGPERRVLVVFALVVVGWLTRPFLLEPIVPGISDPVIAVAGALALFVAPSGRSRGEFLLDWETTKRVPWGVLLLFGAGFSLAAAFRVSGLDVWIADGLTVLRGVHLLIILLAIAIIIVFLSEVASNSATASLFLPVTVTLAASLAVSPLVLMVAVSVAASFAFMLPVGTPPNAIVFGSGYVSMGDMARAGLWLNLAGIVLLVLATYFWLPFVWGL